MIAGRTVRYPFPGL